ncbi:hypothetical protein [Bradyrhizobium sp. STM 3561]|jgi:glycerol-3-phosphate acyltransferase PlsY|uniref:hypothetical protein n=1 Tax=Bradyrhizobium sp. STM 3561 TaxID=578923 RepID=UPI00388FE393
MTQTPTPSKQYGLWLLLAGSIAGCIAAAVAAFDEGNGIAHSAGAYLVLVMTALLVVASVILALRKRKQRWLLVALSALTLFDLVGTGFAAYFLETFPLVAFMAVCLVGWLIYVVTGLVEDDLTRHAVGRTT